MIDQELEESVNFILESLPTFLEKSHGPEHEVAK